MIHSGYDFHGFLQRMAKLNHNEILHEANKECASVERTLSRVKGAPKHREQGGGTYCSQIKEFLFFMQNGKRPGSASPIDFQAYKLIVESLINRGEWKAEMLTQFRKENRP